MNWFIYTMTVVFLFTTYNLLQRKLAVHAKNPRAMAVIFNGIAATMALVIFIIGGSYKNFSLPTQSEAWIALFVAIFCYGMFERYKFTAAKLLDASVLSTIGNLSVLVAVVGSLFIYAENFSTNKLIGSILIILSLFLVSFSKKWVKLSTKGILAALFINIMLGIGWMLDKKGAEYFNINTYNIFVWTVPILFVYFPHIPFKVLKEELKTASWKIYLLAAINVAGYLLQLKALTLAEATRVIPIVQTSTLFTVIIGVIVLKERDSVVKKIIASCMAVVGVYFLSVTH
ncbi:MAG: DMT family transporter [Candidatus Roizmanbacteria bacterium]|nr:DMT family transporter [Candidatus Roizmanbacteria bacterium]